MATMYPSRLDADVQRSERDVYESLKNGLPSDWIAIHGRRFVLPPSGYGRATEGELDFLVVHPERGVLGLEVKGGQEVGRDHDGWYSVPFEGSIRSRIKDPGAQAPDASWCTDHHLYVGASRAKHVLVVVRYEGEGVDR